MALIVQKFGGTSVGSVERIKNIAKRVQRTRSSGSDVLVVLSAMGKETDRLVSLASEASLNPVGRELDVILSAGEQVSIGLLCLALEELGEKAISLLGHQVPIVTDSTFNSARIDSIDTVKIKNAFSEGSVVVVAGFQGVEEGGSITTLGRGGSDTTAVALASALNADLCEIYTDVDGIFTTDPSVCKDARKLEKISYDEMLEMASLGARVLQTRSVEFAKKYEVPLMVRSSFNDGKGTFVTREDKDMEKVMVSGVTYNKDEAKISVVRVPDKPGIAARLFKPLTKEGINVDMIVQNIGHDGHTDMTFTVLRSDYERAMKITETLGSEISASTVKGDPDIAKVSIVGAGMRSHAGVASKMFATLSEAGINIQMISTSEIKISCVVGIKDTEKAVQVLHSAFELSKEEVSEEKLHA